MKVYNNVIELIGKTPLVKYNENIYLKLEFLNPSHSVKDRASYYMLKDAKESGKINDNTVIIEPTSGNTGIGLAMCCAVWLLHLLADECVYYDKSIIADRDGPDFAFCAETCEQGTARGASIAQARGSLFASRILLHSRLSKNSRCPSRWYDFKKACSHYIYRGLDRPRHLSI